MRVLASLLLFLATACGATRIAYTPVASVAREQAEYEVRRFLEEQPEGDAPTSIQILPDKIVLGRNVTRHHMVVGAVIDPVTSTLYWDDLGECELYRRQSWFITYIFDRSHELFFAGFTHDEQRARRFLDALETLKKQSIDSGVRSSQ
jgi:hypothetical protein